MVFGCRCKADAPSLRPGAGPIRWICAAGLGGAALAVPGRRTSDRGAWQGTGEQRFDLLTEKAAVGLDVARLTWTRRRAKAARPSSSGREAAGTGPDRAHGLRGEASDDARIARRG